ncbi:hypothetical protein [Metabacillus fastidiosus]|uniref:hypothetical protein n=1 Tax=Metabacillus fastidiosus TaxID=1458 RepID=UPI003D2D1859
MISLWLATMVIFGFLLITIIFIYYGLKSVLNSKDSHKIDPIPENIDHKKK